MGDLFAPLLNLVESALSNRHQTRAAKRLAYHASIREGLKEVPGALSKLDALLVEEAEDFCKREEYLLRRRFNGNIFLRGIVCSLLTLMALGLTFAWTVQSWAAGWGYWVLLGMSAVTTLLGTLTYLFFRAVYQVPAQASSSAPATNQP